MLVLIIVVLVFGTTGYWYYFMVEEPRLGSGRQVGHSENIDLVEAPEWTGCWTAPRGPWESWWDCQEDIGQAHADCVASCDDNYGENSNCISYCNGAALATQAILCGDLE